MLRGSVLIGSPPTSLWWFYFCTPVSSGGFIQGSSNCICCMWLRRVCSCHPFTCVCLVLSSLVLVRRDVGASDWSPPASSVTEGATSGVPGSNNLLKLLLLTLIVSCLVLTTITKGPLLCKNHFILLMFSKKKKKNLYLCLNCWWSDASPAVQTLPPGIPPAFIFFPFLKHPSHERSNPELLQAGPSNCSVFVIIIVVLGFTPPSGGK